jgi:hypothetical protein
VAEGSSYVASNGGFDLTARESDLLRKAGERVFGLSRQLAASEAHARRLQSELEHTREILAETRQTREILSAQVTTLHREIEREFEERSELRKLLASLQLQLQAMLPSLIAPAAPETPFFLPGRASPQRGSALAEPTETRSRQQVSWIERAAKEFRIRARR